MQLIGIMDRILKRENVDLRLTPYWVLPMSSSSGIMEFVPSTTLQELTAKGKAEGVLRYLAEHSPAVAGQRVADVPYSKLQAAIAPYAMENFVRSNAGYAIISYLMDMGDRHLENLLLTTDGKLFHIGATPLPPGNSLTALDSSRRWPIWPMFQLQCVRYQNCSCLVLLVQS